jgi:hypothetical protein
MVVDQYSPLPNENPNQQTLNARLSSGSDRSMRGRDRSTDLDVLVSLADAYENRRARQVNEWERRQSVRTAR